MKESQRITILLFVLGFSVILVQILVLREFLNVFLGNELIIGVIMAVWMLQTALGAWLERKVAFLGNSPEMVQRLFLMLPLLAGFTLFLMYALNALMFPAGVSKGLLPAFLFANIILIPFCLGSGALFSIFSHRLSTASDGNGMNKGYGWESAGSAVAGILTGTLVLQITSSFSLLGWDLLLHTISGIFAFGTGIRPYRKLIYYSVIILAGLYLCIRPPDQYFRSKLYAGQDILFSGNTPYGNITVTNTSGQINYYENGTFLFSTSNLALQEEMVHYVMLQCSHPQNVLVVSGGMAGMQEQLAKYPDLEGVYYVEINPWLIAAEKQYSYIPYRPWFHVRSIDARTWIRKEPGKYDAIILNLPDPSTAQVNRYFTREFFRDISFRLHRNGYMITSLESSGNYISEDAQKLYQLMYATLRSAFHFVEVLPGERNCFIAGNSPVHTDIVRRADSLGIQNDYVSSAYLDDRLLKLYNRQIMSVIVTSGIKVNQDAHPLGYLLQINFWLSSFGESRWIIILFLLFAIFLTFRRLNPISAAVLTGGFSGASAEFLMIMIFQSMYGLVYQMIGVIVAFYMTGLAAGSLYRWKFTRFPRLAYACVQCALFLFLLLIPWIYQFLASQPDLKTWVGQLVLLSLVFMIALLAGIEFNLANRLWMEKKRGTAISLYSTDLAGAATGLLITSLWIFPMLGLFPASQLAAGLNIFSLIVFLLSGK